MQSNKLYAACLGMLAATGMTVGLTGCSSSEATKAVQRREKTVDTIGDLRQDLIKADAQIVSTQQSLDRLTSQQAGDLKQSYDQFVANTDKEHSIEKKINERSSDLSAESYEHINEWNYQARTIQQDEVKQRSMQREQMSKRDHDQMVASMNDVRASYAQYTRQLDDIRMAAAADLSPDGLAGLRAQADKTESTGQQLRQKMASLDSTLNRVAMAWRTQVPLAERVKDEGAAQPAGTRMQGETPANQPIDSNK